MGKKTLRRWAVGGFKPAGEPKPTAWWEWLFFLAAGAFILWLVLSH